MNSKTNLFLLRSPEPANKHLIKVNNRSVIMIHLDFFLRYMCLATNSQSAFTRSKLTIKTLEQGVKYVQI